MTNAFVLMTAMPPTKGHFNLIKFAASISNVHKVVVLVTTQPSEPYAHERFEAVKQACKRLPAYPYIEVKNYHKQIEQDSSAPGFWPMWDRIMTDYGFEPGDWAVSSEGYGEILASRLKGNFLPYDPARELYYTKATNIRENMVDYFDDILPEFQKHLVTRVTVFGAESTGKTTLSHALADAVKGHWVYEWARPYLELTGDPINITSMSKIWRGQDATQRHASLFENKAFIIQDTDLFSTVGYWKQPHWAEKLGPVPDGLVEDAYETKSDLYIVLRSDIPFEPDPLRYGVDKRESDDAYWMKIVHEYDLPYIEIRTGDFEQRLAQATEICLDEAGFKAQSIYYDRQGH